MLQLSRLALDVERVQGGGETFLPPPGLASRAVAAAYARTPGTPTSAPGAASQGSGDGGNPFAPAREPAAVSPFPPSPGDFVAAAAAAAAASASASTPPPPIRVTAQAPAQAQAAASPSGSVEFFGKQEAPATPKSPVAFAHEALVKAVQRTLVTTGLGASLQAGGDAAQAAAPAPAPAAASARTPSPASNGGGMEPLRGRGAAHQAASSHVTQSAPAPAPAPAYAPPVAAPAHAPAPAPAAAQQWSQPPPQQPSMAAAPAGADDGELDFAARIALVRRPAASCCIRASPLVLI